MKWLGAFLIVAASYFLGNVFSVEEKKKLIAIDSMLSLLKYMHRRMSIERKPLFDIFGEYNDVYLEESGFLMIMQSDRNSKTAWQSAISTLAIDEETRVELKYYGAELGELPLSEQLFRTETCISFLEDKKKTLQKILPPKQKSLKTVCLLSGLLLAIIML